MARRYSPNGIQIGEAAMVLQDCYPEWRLKWRSDRLEFSLSLGASEILVSHVSGFRNSGIWCAVYIAERTPVDTPPPFLIDAPPDYKSESFEAVKRWLLETVPLQ